MKTWIGIGVVVGVSLVVGLGSLIFSGNQSEVGGIQVSGALAEQGLQLALDQGCVACHSLDGKSGIGPSWLGMYGRTEILQDGTTVVVDEDYIRESITQPSAKLVEGYENVMLQYPFTPQQLDALVEFSRQLQPEE